MRGRFRGGDEGIDQIIKRKNELTDIDNSMVTVVGGGGRRHREYKW